MIGGDERVATHRDIAAVLAGNPTAALAELVTLLTACGRVEAAAIVAGAVGRWERRAVGFGKDGTAGPVRAG